MAQLRIKSWNAEKILGRSTQILEDFAPVIAEEARKQISVVQWDWDRGTLRFRSIGMGGKPGKRGGVYVDAGFRDILDTGRLQNSQQPPQISGKSLSIRWAAPYSGVVLAGGDYGSYTNPAGTKYPNDKYPSPNVRKGRNWIAKAFEAEPPLPFFVRRWRELAGGGKA